MRVAVIPARGGSRRIPRKNIRLFHGKPIIAYSIEAAKESGLFQHVVVSTDDEEIAQVAVDFGAGYWLRPPELSEDDVGTQEVASHTLRHIQDYDAYRYVCCIYATAPTMIAADIGAMYAASQLSQWRDICYVKGWMYWGTAQRFLESPELRSSDYRADLVPHRWIDIDTEEDWGRAEKLYEDMKAIL